MTRAHHLLSLCLFLPACLWDPETESILHRASQCTIESVRLSSVVVHDGLEPAADLNGASEFRLRPQLTSIGYGHNDWSNNDHYHFERYLDPVEFSYVADSGLNTIGFTEAVTHIGVRDNEVFAGFQIRERGSEWDWSILNPDDYLKGSMYIDLQELKEAGQTATEVEVTQLMGDTPVLTETFIVDGYCEDGVPPGDAPVH